MMAGIIPLEDQYTKGVVRSWQNIKERKAKGKVMGSK